MSRSSEYCSVRGSGAGRRWSFDAPWSVRGGEAFRVDAPDDAEGVVGVRPPPGTEHGGPIHEVEVQVRRRTVPAVAQRAQDLSPADPVARRHGDRPLLQVGVEGVAAGPQVEDHVVGVNVLQRDGRRVGQRAVDLVVESPGWPRRWRRRSRRGPRRRSRCRTPRPPDRRRLGESDPTPLRDRSASHPRPPARPDHRRASDTARAAPPAVASAICLTCARG